MNSIDNINPTEDESLEMMSRFLSSMGCSLDTNGSSDTERKTSLSTCSKESLHALKICHPSFSLTEDHQEVDECDNDDHSEASSCQREAVQSKASELMSRKAVYYPQEDEDKENNKLPLKATPQRTMLENILDSFDQLVDARIRAYTRILNNHVQVLWESNNIKGARIAEYKLQTLLEFAANHVLFDSVSTEFKLRSTEHDVREDGHDVTTTTTVPKGDRISLPIELTVEIRSPRFFLEGVDVEAISNRQDQGSQLTFRAEGKLRGERSLIGRRDIILNDTDRCSSAEAVDCRNSHDVDHVHGSNADAYFNGIEIDIDCDALLSQMMEEASKVVTMAVELTNQAWTNNTQKQEEINDMAAKRTQETANLIVDEDDDSCAGDDRLLQTMTEKRTRCEYDAESDQSNGTSMSKQVSDHSFRHHTQVVCDDDDADELLEGPEGSHASSPPSAAPIAAATITNLHVLDQDRERFVSSHESSSSGSEHDPTELEEGEDLGEDVYNKISAKRVCDIVDFVLAGDIISSPFSSNKKRRTK